MDVRASTDVKRGQKFQLEPDQNPIRTWVEPDKSQGIKDSTSKEAHTVQEWLEIKIYCLWLFSTFHIHTWWGQAKYVRKFEISRANFEKNQNLSILKNFLWILCINIQNYSNSKELRHK